MDKKERIESIVKYLEIVREMPKFHFSNDVPPVVNFLWGFHLACHALGLADERDDIYGEVQIEHGWEVTALHPVSKMLEQGLDDAAIVNEILNMELEAWKKVYQTVNTGLLS